MDSGIKRLSNNEEMKKALVSFIQNISVLVDRGANFEDLDIALNEISEVMVIDELTYETVTKYEQTTQIYFDIQDLCLVMKRLDNSFPIDLSVLQNEFKEERKMVNFLLKCILLYLLNNKTKALTYEHQIALNDDYFDINLHDNLRAILQKLYIQTLHENIGIYNNYISNTREKSKAISFKNWHLNCKTRRLYKIVKYKELLKESLKKDYDIALDRIEQLQTEKNNIESSKIIHKDTANNYRLVSRAYEDVNKNLMNLFLEAQNNYIQTLDKLIKRSRYSSKNKKSVLDCKKVNKTLSVDLYRNFMVKRKDLNAKIELNNQNADSSRLNANIHDEDKENEIDIYNKVIFLHSSYSKESNTTFYTN